MRCDNLLFYVCSAKNNWWYNGCPTCHRHVKQEPDSNQFTCTQHDVQVPLPCYRLYMTIEDHENEVTVVLMGRQAEQIFGTTCQELVNKRAYPNQHTLPPEIENAVDQRYLFQLKFNQYRELVVKAVYPDQQDSSPSTLLQPTIATAAHPASPRKRTIQTRSKAPFDSETEKKTKREAEQHTATSSVEKEDQQMKKTN
ncbi:hypothetical protein ABKV19_005565 [Rosa sericea]